jgi:hypothetical protein
MILEGVRKVQVGPGIQGPGQKSDNLVLISNCAIVGTTNQTCVF